MPTTTWNTTTIDGQDYLVISVSQFMVPLDWDPSSNMFIAVAAPSGGLGSFPALVQGDPGVTPIIDGTIVLTALEYTDPTPDSASWTTLAPNTYQLHLALHKGATGAAGANTILGSTDLAGTPAAGQMIIVNPAANGFVFTSPKVGDRYLPATINSAPTGNPQYLLCQVSVPAQLFDWRPEVEGYCIITGTSTDVQVDLIARLNDASAGNEVGRAPGFTGINPPTHVLFSGPPPGSSATYDKVAAGSPATIYLRSERQNGTGTYSTSATTTRFKVRVAPIP